MRTRIDLEIGDGLATVTLHNPAKLNAVNASMWRGLSAAMTRIADDDSVRCVIVRGAGDEAFAAAATSRSSCACAPTWRTRCTTTTTWWRAR